MGKGTICLVYFHSFSVINGQKAQKQKKENKRIGF